MAKIGVIGAGAIGGSLGGFMAKEGYDVTLIDPWRAHIEAMRENGLLLDGSTGEQRVEVNALHTDELDQIDGKFDILIVAVKSYDTKWALNLMMPYTHGDTIFVSPQNGINELQIAPIVGARRMVGCVTTISAGMYEPGHVTRTQGTGRSRSQTGADPIGFKVGELDGRVTPRVEELARIFSASARTVVTQDLWGERWTKLVTNSMVNATSAMTGLSGYELKANDGARKIVFKIGIETVNVGRTLGYNTEVPLGNYSLEDLERAASDEGYPELEKEYVGEPQTIPGRPSMAQDMMKGRKTEIDYLNGFVVDSGKRIGVPAPYNGAAQAVVKGIEAGEFQVGLENIERLESIARASR
ncbi:MAG: 2-dehydropantoate 2-reductase [Chloroflexi bacterium]|nr:2-dehydropantoate 2-reductase [Chloroflexota bacterium]